MTEHERESGVVRNPEQAKDQRLDKVDSAGRGEYGQAPELRARVVVGVFDSHADAADAARALGDDASLVSAQPGQAPETSADETGSDAGGAAGVAAGALVGAAIASLAVPGLGLLVVGGPILAALGGAAVGGALGGLIGALNGLGIPSDEAREYEAAVRAGKSIVTVRARDTAHAEATERELRERGAQVVHSYQDEL